MKQFDDFHRRPFGESWGGESGRGLSTLHASCERKRGLMNPKGVASRISIPKGLRIKAQGCESRATLGKRGEGLSTPTGLRLMHADHHTECAAATPLGLWVSEQLFPRVARASQPWAGGHNPVGIEF